MSNEKYCIDCMWCLPIKRTIPGLLWDKVEYKYDDNAKCSHPNTGRNLVTGAPKLPYCEHEREKSWGKCGKEGKNWEAK